MKPSDQAYEFIKSYEGLRLMAYPDPGSENGLPITIGYGTTMYDDGRKPKLGDVITKDRALQLLKWEVDNKAKSLDAFINGVPLTQNMYDSLCSLIYNIGVGGFQKSTLLKKIKINPSDPSIEHEFLRWNKNNGKAMNGLTKRRQNESDLYFSP